MGIPSGGASTPPSPPEDGLGEGLGDGLADGLGDGLGDVLGDGLGDTAGSVPGEGEGLGSGSAGAEGLGSGSVEGEGLAVPEDEPPPLLKIQLLYLVSATWPPVALSVPSLLTYIMSSSLLLKSVVKGLKCSFTTRTSSSTLGDT